MNKKQAIYWLLVALQIHSKPEIVEAFQIAMDELYKKLIAKNSMFRQSTAKF